LQKEDELMRDVWLTMCLVAGVAGMAACGDDAGDTDPIGATDGPDGTDDTDDTDDTDTTDPVRPAVVLSEVYYGGGADVDYIEILNDEDEAVDVSDYFLCLRVGAYFRLGEVAIAIGEDFVLDAGERVVVRAPEDLGQEGTVALYSVGGAFADPTNITSFIQWGAADVPDTRTDVAVAAGLWVDGAFLAVAAADEAVSLNEGAGTYGNAVPSPGLAEGVTDRAVLVQLSPDAEVPPVVVPSEAAGAVLTAVGPNWIAAVGGFDGLTSPLMNIGEVGPVHVHLALPQPGHLPSEATGPVDFVARVDRDADELGAHISVFDRLDEGLVAGDNEPADRFQALQDGRYYYSIHTSSNPTGELRGQIDFGTTPMPDRPLVVLSEVGYTGDVSEDFVELQNIGEAPLDLSGYFLCFAVGDYAGLATLSILDGGDLTLDPGETLLLDPARDLAGAAGLGLYRNDDGFGDPANIVDYVRWGDGSGAGDRADVAVQAGLWSEAEGGFDFVDAAGPGQTLSFVGGAELLSTSDDFENGIPSPGQANDEVPALARQVIINEVLHTGDAFVDYIELRNVGDRTIDVSGFQLCPRVRVYVLLSDLDILVGDDLVLEPGELLVLGVGDLGDQGAAVLYWRGGAFANPDTMADYMQWGSGMQTGLRDAEAAAAGLWTAGDFVPAAAPGQSLSLLTGEDRRLSEGTDYVSQALSFGFPNPAADRSGISDLSPDNEVPPVSTPSSAEGTVAVAIWNGQLALIGGFEGLSSQLIEPVAPFGPGHLHRGLRQPTQRFGDATGPIAYALEIPSQGPDDRASIIRGRFDLVADNLLSADVTPNDIAAAFQEGQYYVNIHTAANPSGELRAPLVFDGSIVGAGLDRDVAINEVRYDLSQAGDFIELVNLGPGVVDLTAWQLCYAVGAYDPLASATILGSGDLVLDPGEILTLRSQRDLTSAQGLGLYSSAAFSNPDAMVDYVRWGNGNGAGDRADIAVAAGLWTETTPGTFDFVPTAPAGASLQFVRTSPGTDSSSADFDNRAPTEGQPN
jgi:hypothetical protein